MDETELERPGRRYAFAEQEDFRGARHPDHAW